MRDLYKVVGFVLSVIVGVLGIIAGIHLLMSLQIDALSPNDKRAEWAGAIGTVATLAMTIWLATSEQRRRSKSERDLALVTIVGLTFRISIARLNLDFIGATLLSDMTEGRATNYEKILSSLDQVDLWSPADLVPLVGIENHLAARLAFVSAEISGVRIAITMATKSGSYEDPMVSRMFNGVTLSRINGPIEILGGCLTRCREYTARSGFDEQSPIIET